MLKRLKIKYHLWKAKRCLEEISKLVSKAKDIESTCKAHMLRAEQLKEELEVE